MTRARKNLRLRHYDYSTPGAYFVTVCVRGRLNSLGDIADETMQLNEAGQVVLQAWQGLTVRFPVIKLDEFVVMPNHVHGIIQIVAVPFMAPVSSAPELSGAINRAPTLGEIVRTFKAVSTRAIRQQVLSSFTWQRNYYEHIIRNDNELLKIREYIANNPLQWALDRENPAATGRVVSNGYAAIFGSDFP